MRHSSVGQPKASSTSKPHAGGRRRIMIWLMSVLAFGGWAIFTFFSQAVVIADKNELLTQKQQEEQKASQAAEQLQSDVSRLKDPEYIGDIARSKYGLYKPDETPIISGNK